MSQPVFGRQPSRPLPRDGDSEPTEEFEIELTDDGDASGRGESDPEGDPAAHGDEDVEAAEPAGATEPEGDPAALDVEELESDEPATEPEGDPAALDVEELESDEPAAEPEAESEGETAVLDVEELEADEPAIEPEAELAALDVEELDGEPTEPVVVDAEAVSAEPSGATGFEAAWIEIQAQFVDDPQAATAGALRMLRERLDGLAPAGASTEDLRVAFRRYRAAWYDLAEK